MKVEFPQFNPTFIKANRGATVTLTLVNTNKVADFQPNHTFTSDILGVSVELQQGTTKTITFTLPSDGAPVRFYCIPHGRAGQQGAFYFS